MPRWKILVSDRIAKEGLDMLTPKADVDVKTGLPPEELGKIIGDYDALIVRSETQVTADIINKGKNLQVIGRAGVGVDNIDVDAATRQGITVVNAPTGNTIAATEHTMALILAMSRFVAQADASMRKGEWNRAAFTGTEIRGKTLGIIGLGKVGIEVARRARAFEMNIIAHDPYVSQDHATVIGAKLVTMEELLKESDYITVHVPLTSSTTGLIGAKELATCKKTVRIINVARGGVIDEQALYDAAEAGKIAGAAVDVFSKEPAKDNILAKSSKIIVTPHLGASTAEAQTGVAIEVAAQFLAMMEGNPARYAVNAPMIMPEALGALSPFVDVCVKAGSIAMQMCEGQPDLIKITYTGEIAKYDTTLLKPAVIRGILGNSSDIRVNVINVNQVVQARGYKIVEQKETESDHYTSMIAVELTTSRKTVMVAGTSTRGETHIVRLDEYWLDLTAPGGYILLIRHTDRPGMIGAVGTETGKQNANISFMEVGRLSPKGRAIMAVGLDDALPEAALKGIRAIPGITEATVVKV
ncbi:MAG: phosphoglycerate dehydrogenase [Dehalococcoidia bacterium]|nr:phosphoglycerate dehydrogenase [Dehalococcoidia bacterium]